MKNFHSLINLVKKLSREEVKSLFKYLKYYNENISSSKSSELLELILCEKDLSVSYIQKKIYGEINLFAFNKLVDRLKEKALEVTLFDSNISKNYYPERTKVIFDLKKKLIQCDILSLKGLRDDGDVLCKKIISKAEKYELHDIVLSALLIRQRFINVRKKQSEILIIQKSIELADEKYKSVIEAQSIYNSIINKINNAADSASYLTDLVDSVRRLEIEYARYYSEIVGYFLFFLKSELFQVEGDYEMAEECFSKIRFFLEKKSNFSEARMGSTLLNIANIKIHLNKYEEAIQCAQDSKKYFLNNAFNLALLEEFLFYSNFYKGDLVKAESIIRNLVNLPEANNISFNINKWKYLFAALDFKMGHFDSCINKLLEVSEIDKDKEGWNFNLRLLLILSRIELSQFESVDLQVASLEKFIKRSIKKRDVRMRYVIIMRILIKLINSNYNFNLVYTNRKKHFDQLASDVPEFKWKIKGPELIIFENWFKLKLKPDKNIV